VKIAVAVLFALACDDGDLSQLDGGITSDGGDSFDADLPPDDAAVDAGTEDVGPYPCDPFAVTSPETPAATTGQIEIVDYDFWDDIDGRRARVRNAGLNFLTGTLPPVPLATGALFPAVPIDQCIVTDVLLSMEELGPARNVGNSITIENEVGDKSIVAGRMVEAEGIRYGFPTQQDLINFFDPTYLAFDERWTYSTDGDPTAGIRAASATLEPFDDFALLSPPVSSSSTAVMLDGDFTWTGTGTKGRFSIILGRALNMEGDARYAVCNPEDDGSFTVPASVIADFGPTPGLPFDVIVSRASAAPFCNEGVTSGLILHVLAYIGGGVVP
jgi:hypothetical protein